MQASPAVQAFPSLHAVPSAAAGTEQAPVTGSQVPATWHWSAAAQVTGVAPAHVPARQTSIWVHALPSLQAVPSGAAGVEQAPVVGLHVPETWHWSAAEQVTGFEPVQTPAWQVSVWVQALPSSQLPPLTGAQVPRNPWSPGRRRRCPTL
jgi:hypothetical protein